jgi:sulfate adenylyltransferase subunit 1
VHHKVNISTLENNEEDKAIGLNDICRISLRTTAPLVIDKYSSNRNTGSIILIDENTYVTVAAGMII